MVPYAEIRALDQELKIQWILNLITTYNDPMKSHPKYINHRHVSVNANQS